MAVQILTDPSDAEQVRKLLDGALTADDLPDETILLPVFTEVGEAILITQVPAWQSLTGPDALFFRSAVMAQVAALLAPAMPGILPKSEEGMTYKVTREPVDWERKAKTLEAAARANLGRISTRSAAGLPASFVLSGPTRKAGNRS